MGKDQKVWTAKLITKDQPNAQEFRIYSVINTVIENTKRGSRNTSMWSNKSAQSGKRTILH